MNYIKLKKMKNINYDDLLSMGNLDENEDGEIMIDENQIYLENTSYYNKSNQNKNLLKKKRQRKNKNKKTKFQNTPQKSNCFLKSYYDNEISGSLLVKEFEIDQKNKILTLSNSSTPSKIKSKMFFIAKIKEINFKTDQNLFLKGRKENSSPTESEDFPNINFWHQRYYYFSQFDQGIKLDYESWYSVTPEEISIHIADSCKDLTVVDAFCGCGGNTIQFSSKAKVVYSIDIDPIKIGLCKQNAEIYSCPGNVQWVNSDYLKIKDVLPNISADCVFLSPPWGGMDYKSDEGYSLKQWVTPDITEIIKTSLKISKNLIFYLPRNTNIEELFSIIADVLSGDCSDKQNDSNEMEEDSTLFAEVQILNSANKVKALLIFFGDKYNHVTVKDLRKYLFSLYPNIEVYQLNQLINLAKVIGVSKFIRSEFEYRKSLLDLNKIKINLLIKSIKDELLNKEELIEFNQLEQKARNQNKNENKNKANQNIPCIEIKFDSSINILSEEEWNGLKSRMI